MEPPSNGAHAGPEHCVLEAQPIRTRRADPFVAVTFKKFPAV